MSTVPASQSRLTRIEILDVLRAHKPELARQFHVKEIALFGSFARDQANEDSDIDILVWFNAPATPRWFFATQSYLADLLGRRIDLVTNKALRAEFRPCVEAEAIHV